jgi:HK97 family phage prohead protease
MDRFAVEFRAELEGDTLKGHAAVFDSMAKLPGHYEALARTAFDEVLKSPDLDVRALVNHDPSQLLGRTPRTLRLSTDAKGLAFEVDLPDTRAAADLRVLLGRGDLSGMSFGFKPGTDTWGRAPDGTQLRTHTSVSDLRDVSVVTYPAYAGTDVALRSLQSFTFSAPARSQMIQARHRVRQGRETT